MKTKKYSFIIAALFWIGLYTFPSYLPVHVHGIVQDLSLTGAILSMYGLVQLFIRLPLGIISDVFGKRKLFIFLGLLALGTGPILLIRSTSTAGLYIGRAITGFAAATWVPLSAQIIDRSSEDIYSTTNALSFVQNLASILAVIFAPLLSLLELEMVFTFWAASFAALVALIIWVFTSGESIKKMRIKKDRLVWAEFKNSSSLIAGFLYAVIQFGIYSATFTFIPLLGRKFMLPDGQFNSLLVFYFIVSMGTNMILKKILNAGNKRIFGILSFLSLSIGIVIMGYSSNYIQLLLAQFMIGISHGIGMPLFLGIAMSDSRSENRAISVGIFQSVYALGMFSGPPASTRLAEIFGFERMSILIGLFICGIAFITFLSFKNQLFPSK